MTGREHYNPTPARGAQVQKAGENWTLTLIRELQHSPGQLWQALTEPEQLLEWAPFDADRSLGTAGDAIKLTTVGAPASSVSETTVMRAVAPSLLEYQWGGNELRWGLEPVAGGTRLTLRHAIDRRYLSMAAAGWHICFDMLDQFLAGHPIGRTVGPELMNFEGFQQLNADYAKQLNPELSSK